MKDMIGYCGLDCEKCDAYIATINDEIMCFFSDENDTKNTTNQIRK